MFVFMRQVEMHQSLPVPVMVPVHSAVVSAVAVMGTVVVTPPCALEATAHADRQQEQNNYPGYPVSHKGLS